MFDDASPKCPQCGYGQPWGVEVRGEYDGVLFWDCPSCNHRWPRFPEKTRLHKLAQEAIGRQMSGEREV